MKVYDKLAAFQPLMDKLNLSNGMAIENNGLVYISGWTALDMATGLPPEGDFETHCDVVLDLVERNLQAVGLGLDHVIKVNCSLVETSDFPVWNAVFKRRFTAPYPCRTTVGAALSLGRIELDVIASLSKRTAPEYLAMPGEMLLPAQPEPGAR